MYSPVWPAPEHNTQIKSTFVADNLVQQPVSMQFVWIFSALIVTNLMTTKLLPSFTLQQGHKWEKGRIEE